MGQSRQRSRAPSIERTGGLATRGAGHSRSQGGQFSPQPGGRRRPDLADVTTAHRRRLERELERLLARKPTNAECRKLRDAVYVDCSDKLFVLLKRRDAEPANNESKGH